MKRFTETEKWKDAWFRKLPVRLKCLWQYFCDNCDHAGVIDPDWELLSFQIGEDVGESDLKVFGDRIKKLSCGKFWVIKFIEFQYGELSPDCMAHRPVFKALEKHTLSIGYQKGINTLKDKDKDKDKEEDQETDKDKDEGGVGETSPALVGSGGETGCAGKGYHAHSRAALHWLNEKCGRHYRETNANLRVISARLSENGVEIEGVKAMISRQVLKWKDDAKMADYLRPETLFGKTKFDGYYAARDLPLNSNGNNNGHHPSNPQRISAADQRKVGIGDIPKIDFSAIT